jgi:hypothetical protein
MVLLSQESKLLLTVVVQLTNVFYPMKPYLLLDKATLKSRRITLMDATIQLELLLLIPKEMDRITKDGHYDYMVIILILPSKEPYTMVLQKNSTIVGYLGTRLDYCMTLKKKL